MLIAILALDVVVKCVTRKTGAFVTQIAGYMTIVALIILKNAEDLVRNKKKSISE